MFRQQTVISEALPSLRALLGRYERPADWLATIEADTQNFVVRVPLVGAFSAGKSSLLNAFVGTPIFATNIDPETATPAEISHAEHESFTACFPDGRRLSLSREDVRENQLSALQPSGWVEIALPLPQLAALSHLRLVDMPGWDSGIEGHTTAIDGYAARSLAYCVVVSADEGNLRESIRLALIELAVHNLPLIAIINKADKKPPEEIDAIASKVAADIETITGKPPLRVIKVSARKKDISEFSAALSDLENLAEPLFTQAVATPFVAHLAIFKGYLGTLTNRDDLDSERISAAIAKIETEIKFFETQLTNETHALEARVAPVLGKVMQRVKAALEGQLTSLSSTAAHGGDINSALSATIRLAVTQGFEEDFNPEMRRYLSRVAEAIPPSIEALIRLPRQQDQSTEVAKDLFIASSPMLAKLSLKIPVIGPYVAAAITAVATLLALFGAGKGNRDQQEAEKLEHIRQNILNEVIPKAVEQTQITLAPVLLERIAEAKSNIEVSVQAQRNELTAALRRLQAELAQGNAAYEKKSEQYRTDLATVTNLITQVGIL